MDITIPMVSFSSESTRKSIHPPHVNPTSQDAFSTYSLAFELVHVPQRTRDRMGRNLDIDGAIDHRLRRRGLAADGTHLAVKLVRANHP